MAIAEPLLGTALGWLPGAGEPALLARGRGVAILAVVIVVGAGGKVWDVWRVPPLLVARGRRDWPSESPEQGEYPAIAR